MKNVSTTRWSSREVATKCLLLNLPKIYAALRKIADNPKPDASSYAANNLAKKMCKFRFICGVIVWHSILSRINVVSKSLQAHSIDITNCLTLVENLKQHFNEVRESENNLVFEEWFEKAKQIQTEFCLEPIASDNLAAHQRPARFGIDDLNEDKASFVYPILDVALLKLQERFEYLTEVKNVSIWIFV